ncbi:MAG: Verru_Chthon cassette protein A, partial [Verrucomicrobiales bacterium]|nr:Verru_Chthon cassette protein A [Verrucomicrobiales bacterium]
MKTVNPSGLSKKARNDRKGVALITVLTVTSLATIMVLTFFALAQSEHRASATYSQGLQAQQVAEQAVNMVVAQIRKATSDPNYLWASQPGAIRTWNSSEDFIGYKLYSDDRMEVDDERELVNEDFDELGNWSERPDEFVDLNEPVIRGTKVYFPIVDPLARDIPKWPRQIGNDSEGVEGFDYNNGSGGATNSKLPAMSDKGPMAEVVKSETKNEVLPLPVRWIYQLGDGTLGYLSNLKFVRLSGTGTPGRDNPMVARFGFWADDETTKLNMNTHSGGLAWDIPKAGGELDRNMGKFQPAQHEWQRYPGHPATTHLVPVLAPGVIDIVHDRDAMDMLFDLVPRVVPGGSNSGTRKVDPRKVTERNGLIADKNPLYASYDELMMQPDRRANIFPDASGRPIDEDEIADHLERSKFFLTVVSRSPETTPFNTPKVATWPIYNAEPGDSKWMTHLTPFDRVIQF